MELGLKSLWSEIQRFDKSQPTVPRTHQLVKLWAGIKPWLVQKKLLASADEFVSSAERIFTIFDQLDPNGTAYRYPPGQLPHRDIINFSLEDFDKAIDQIDTVFFALRNSMNDYEEFQVALARGTPP
jgi:hypothetical protein